MTRSDRLASFFGLAAAALLACLPVRSLAQGQPSADLIARGKYLTDMGDCVACHAAPGYPKFAGGQYMQMPFGVISTPNITPDHDTGIGYYTDDDFIRLMQRGIRPNGQRIYPAMPYPWYATVPKSDLLAIKAYLFSLKPVHAPRLENHIWFPFTIRPAIALWDAFFVPTKEFTPDPSKSAELNRGAYIVGGLEHCGTCHNGRNFLGNTAIAGDVEGAPITRWYAPNLRPDNMTGIGRYSVDDLVSFFKYGHSKSMGTVAGPMSETGIDDVASRIGVPVRHQGDAGESIYWACARLDVPAGSKGARDAASSLTLWLLSDAEATGRRHAVTALALDGIRQDGRSCPVPEHAPDLTLDARIIRPGSQAERIAGLYGHAPRREGRTAFVLPAAEASSGSFTLTVSMRNSRAQTVWLADTPDN